LDIDSDIVIVGRCSPRSRENSDDVGTVYITRWNMGVRHGIRGRSQEGFFKRLFLTLRLS
jgi:hypothetical protein